MKSEEFDRRFDDGEDMTPYLDMSTVSRPGLEPEHIDLEFPSWVVSALDFEASKLGLNRQALITVWLTDRLKRERQESTS